MHGNSTAMRCYYEVVWPVAMASQPSMQLLAVVALTKTR